MAKSEKLYTLDQLMQALRALGQRVEGYDEIEILIVGGVAGMLSGQLRADRMTVDVDVMDDNPEGAFGKIEMAAVEVAKEMRLNPQWFNDKCRTFARWLPQGWQQRRQHVGDFGLLRVYRVDRFDFIALKVLSGRAADQQDLLDLGVTGAEITAVRQHVDQLEGGGEQSGAVEVARIILTVLEERV